MVLESLFSPFTVKKKPWEMFLAGFVYSIIGLAKTREYAVLFIDLKWGPYLPAEGYRLLQECREYAPIMILWTSESAEARERGYQHGATHCIGKNPLPEELEEILAEVK
jgi:DNA-binding NarL/FixJ family response regulator